MKKESIIRISVVCVSILLLCIITGFNSFEKASSSDDLSDEDLLKIATKQAADISDDERSEATKISTDEFLDLYSADEESLVLFVKDSCEYCKLALPIIENIIYENNLDVKEIDLDALSSDDKSRIASTDKYFSEGVSTPTILIVGKNSVVDSIEGLFTREDYVSFLKNYEFME